MRALSVLDFPNMELVTVKSTDMPNFLRIVAMVSVALEETMPIVWPFSCKASSVSLMSGNGRMTALYDR